MEIADFLSGYPEGARVKGFIVTITGLVKKVELNYTQAKLLCRAEWPTDRIGIQLLSSGKKISCKPENLLVDVDADYKFLRYVRGANLCLQKVDCFPN